MEITLDEAENYLIALKHCETCEANDTNTCKTCPYYRRGSSAKCYDAIDVAIDTMSKYQQLQADYENRLKSAVAMLEKLNEKLKKMHERYSAAEHWDEAYGVAISMEEVRKKINDLVMTQKEEE